MRKLIMEFHNNTKLKDITDTNVDIVLVYDIEASTYIPMCETFIYKNKLWVDFKPSLNRKYIAEIPSDSLVSRNEDNLEFGRYGVFIHIHSKTGKYCRMLVEQSKI